MKGSVIFSDPKLNAEIEHYGKIKKLGREDVLMRPGEKILFVPIVLKGSIRVLREDREGKEIFLYHLYPGQTCAMSLTCCQSGKESQVKAICEDDCELLLIPVEQIENWFIYPEWKAYISSNYNNRFEELLQVIDLVAFHHMDKQLLHYLEERTKALGTRILEITHQQIADELHSHREAISRLLRLMEQKGQVKLGRNSVEVLTLW